ncbi:hypothetical protein Droror1_Dr00019235 [Drosera rotundifolia]
MPGWTAVLVFDLVVVGGFGGGGEGQLVFSYLISHHDGHEEETEASVHLPSELLFFDILVRLPVKSLLRFRCVCKTWHDIIERLDFETMHLNVYHNNRNRSRLLGMYHNGIEVIGKWGGPLLLWNPSIRKHMMIPPPSHDHPDEFKVRHAKNGLGYDSIDNYYKVLVMMRRGDLGYPTMVYSLCKGC